MSTFVLVYPELKIWGLPAAYISEVDSFYRSSDISKALRFDSEKAANEAMRRIRMKFGGSAPIVKQVAA